jgi:hypothetical protein
MKIEDEVNIGNSSKYSSKFLTSPQENKQPKAVLPKRGSQGKMVAMPSSRNAEAPPV